MKKIQLIVACLIAIHMSMAQDRSPKKQSCSCSFQSNNQIGLLEGKTGSAFQLQTINGIRYKTWFAGVGAGLDYYHRRSIPLFVDIRKDILKNKKTPFLYADGGVNFSWGKEDGEGTWHVEYGNGHFYEAGLGYKFGLKNNMALFFSAGYSYKSSVEKRYGVTYCPFLGPCVEGLIERFDYSLNRLSLKAGFSF